MDTKFQTSFIPKKPILSDQRVTRQSFSAGTSIFMLLSIAIFIGSIAIAGYTFVRKDFLLKYQAVLQEDLKNIQEKFDLELVDRLRKANTKIDLSNQFLKRHLATSELFYIINSLTIDGVRFNSFEFSTPEKAGEEIKLTLKGVGSSFASIAFQSDVFGNSEQYGKNIKLSNPVLSDLVLDQAGNVEFAFTSTINPKDILFSKTLGVESTSTQP